MKALCFSFLICIALVCKCSIAPNAGGTTDTGNAKVAAVIYTQDGHPAAGASVILVPSTYLSGIGSDSSITRIKYEQVTITDDSGYFQFDSIINGDYCIEINDKDSSSVLLNIMVSQEADSTIHLNDTLQPYATIEGNVGSISDTSIIRYLLIYGLDRLIPVKNDGTFLISDIPAGIFDIKIDALGSVWVPVQIESVVVNPTETVSIPFAGYNYSAEVTLNTSSSGANIATNVYNFPVLIRLTGDIFDFSKTDINGSDLRFVKSDGTQLAFDVEQWDISLQKACIWVKIDTVYGNNSEQSFTVLWGNPNAISLSNSAGVFDTSSGFLGSYHLGGNVTDATLNHYDGQDNGTADLPEGVVGRARSFNGLSYINVGDLPDRQFGAISCWFRTGITINKSLGTTEGIWGKKDTDSLNFNLSFRGADFYLDSTIDTGSLISKMENPSNGYYLSSSTLSFTAGVWYFATWSWGEGGDSLYVNGILESSVPNSLPVTGNGNDEIGRSLYDPSNIMSGEARYFYGALDEFRIDNKTRSAQWVRLCYMNQRTDDKLVNIKW